jgi:hypothetical protein
MSFTGVASVLMAIVWFAAQKFIDSAERVVHAQEARLERGLRVGGQSTLCPLATRHKQADVTLMSLFDC